jgi:hypothetical protein
MSQESINKIYNYECPILNIENRKGHTGYIDFIQEKELGENSVMKGMDCIQRPFIIIKAELILSNGDTIPTISTFFQRYNDCKSLWQCCGHDGRLLMNTDGGMSEIQFEFLNKLLNVKEKVVDLDLDTIKKLRLNYDFNDKDLVGVIPIQLRLREKEIKKEFIIVNNSRFVF